MNHIEELLKSLFIMSFMVEARDPYTGGHLWRVSQFSRLLAEDAGLADTDVARVTVGGFLHDLGKIGVPDGILNKPAGLTGDEYAIMKTHPEVGSRLLSDHPLAALVRQAVLSHHERPDGQGYPHGLADDTLGVDARIVGICDAFDAMTSTRPYRPGMATERALAIIGENLGRQFDPDLGRRFLDLGARGGLAHIVGHSEPHIPLQTCPACGPIIVVTRRHRSGDHVYCPHCGGETVLHRDGDHIRLTPTGRRGGPGALAPEVDDSLLDHLVEESGRFIRIGRGRKETLFARLAGRLRPSRKQPAPA